MPTVVVRKVKIRGVEFKVMSQIHTKSGWALILGVPGFDFLIMLSGPEDREPTQDEIEREVLRLYAAGGSKETLAEMERLAEDMYALKAKRDKLRDLRSIYVKLRRSI